MITNKNLQLSSNGTFNEADLLSLALQTDNPQKTLKNIRLFNEYLMEAQADFFDENFNPVTIKTEKSFNRGQCGKVFIIENSKPKVVLKKYFKETEACFRIKYPVFSLLREIKHPNIINTLGVYYSTKPTSIKSSTIDAFSYYYVTSEKVRITDEPKSYLLENFYDLEQLIKLLSENQILLMDLKPDNTILNSQRIILSDPCCYITSPYPKKTTERKNKLALLALIRELLSTEIKGIPIVKTTSTLFSDDLIDFKSMASAVNKRLIFTRKFK